MKKFYAIAAAVSMTAALMLTGCQTEKAVKTTAAKTTEAAPVQTEAQTEKATEVQTEAQTEKITEVQTEAQTEKATEVQTEAKSEEVTEVQTEAQTEAKTEEATEAAALNEKVRVIAVNLTEEEYAFGVDKTQPELLEKTNEFIAKIMEDGTFEEICNHYFGDGEPVAVSSSEYDASKEQLVVATNAAFEPFEYMKGENYYGVDMEIAALLADYLGQELVINNMDFDAVCLSVGQQKCDIAMAGLTVKEERKEHVDFTESYYNASQVLIVKADDTTFDNCKTAEDVEAILKTFDKKTVIGVQNGTTGQFYVEGDEDWGFDGYGVTCTGYKNGSLAVQDLINGNIDYVVIDEAPAQKITAALNSL